MTSLVFISLWLSLLGLHLSSTDVVVNYDTFELSTHYQIGEKIFVRWSLSFLILGSPMTGLLDLRNRKTDQALLSIKQHPEPRIVSIHHKSPAGARARSSRKP